MTYSQPKLFRRENFFSSTETEALRLRLLDAESQPATISERSQAKLVIDRTDRDTDEVTAKASDHHFIEDRVTSLYGELGDWFDCQVSKPQSPRFLRYGPGQFFLRHPDTRPDPKYPADIRARKITTVLYLNGWDRKPEDGGFTGGELVVFPDEATDDGATTIIPSPGLLVAFKSTVEHEVKPVIAGQRWSVVCWHCA